MKKLTLLLWIILCFTTPVLAQERNHVSFTFPEWNMWQGAGTAASIYKSLYANLGTPVDSSVRYCSDCQATTPCSSGGTGAFASRVNGVWNCAAGGSGAPGISCSGCSVDTVVKYNGSALVNSRFTDNGTDLTANSGAGKFRAGDTSLGSNGSYFEINDVSKTITLSADDNNTGSSLNLTGGAGPSVQLQQGNGIGTLQFSGDTQAFGSTGASVTFDQSLTSASFDVSVIGPTNNGATDLGSTTNGYKQLFFDATITAGGTTGNQTINKSAWTVNFAALASSLTVTSNKVTTSSIVICTVQTNDTTLKAVQAVPGSGSVVLFGNAAATAETKVGCWILNQ